MLTLMIFRNMLTLMNSSAKCFGVARTVLCLGPSWETRNFMALYTVWLRVITSRLLLLALSCGMFRLGTPNLLQNVLLLLYPHVSDWNHHLHICPSQKPEHYLTFPTASSSSCTQHPPSQSVTILSKYALLICLWDFPSPYLLHL